MPAIRLTVRDARIAFANDLFTAKSIDGSKPAYASSFLIPPNHSAIAEAEKAFVSLSNEKWGAKGPAILAAMKKTDKLCLHDGNLKTYAGYAGNMYFSARNPVRPKVKARNGQDDVSADSGIIYSGCRVIAFLELWAQDHPKGGKRINATLRGVQFMRDDEAFTGGGAAGDDEFEDLGVDADEAAALLS